MKLLLESVSNFIKNVLGKRRTSILKPPNDYSFFARRKVLPKEKAQEGLKGDSSSRSWRLFIPRRPSQGFPRPLSLSVPSSYQTRCNIRILSAVNKDGADTYQPSQGKAEGSQATTSSWRVCLFHLVASCLSLLRMLFVLCCHFQPNPGLLFLKGDCVPGSY